MLDNILNLQVFHTQVSVWLTSIAILIVGMVAVRIITSFTTRRLKARVNADPTPLGEFLIDRIHKTGIPMAYLCIIAISMYALELPPRINRVVDIAGIVLTAILLTQFAVTLVRFSLQEYVSKQGESASRDRVLKGISSLLNAFVWIIGILFMLDNLGFRVSTIMAGLGIGGIAVALAAQTILGNLFAYFIILFDRPFEIGDYIVVGDYQGTVERFGIKTTRILGRGGEQIIVSNKDLTDSYVRNFKRMKRRRVAFQLGVAYETSMELLRKIPEIIDDIFNEIEGASLDQACFASFGDFSLIYEIVYFVENNQYRKYMDLQHAINLRIAEEFMKNNIQFAYPTQTLYLKHEGNQRLMTDLG